MKKIFFICFCTLILASCKDENKQIDVTVMPPETATGADTFGCLVDGWIYVGGRYTDNYGNTPSINFTSNSARTEIKVRVKVRKYEYIAFTINEPPKEVCTFTNAQYILEPQDGTGASNVRDLGNGIVAITRFDDTIISGYFKSDNNNPISHGQFDVKYRIKN